MTSPGKVLALIALAVLATSCGRSRPYENRSLGQLQGMLDEDDPNVQTQGAMGLAALGGEGAPAIPRLLELLHSPSPLVRQTAAMALGKVGKEAPEVPPALTSLLADREWTVRRQAALALGEMGASAAPALPRLEQMAGRDPDSLTRKGARAAVKKIRASSGKKGGP